MTGEQCDILHTDLMNILDEIRKIKEWCEPHWEIKPPEVKENMFNPIIEAAATNETPNKVGQPKNKKSKKNKNLFGGDSDHEK